MNGHRFPRFFLVAALAVALLLTACSDDDDEPSASTGAEAGSVIASTQSPQPPQSPGGNPVAGNLIPSIVNAVQASVVSVIRKLPPLKIVFCVATIVVSFLVISSSSQKYPPRPFRRRRTS